MADPGTAPIPLPSTPPARLDTQVIELLGRNLLIDQLLRAGLEVAIPNRDRGVDLIAYADLSERVDRFIARPIQLKAASTRAFMLDRKYERISDLIIAYVWHVNDPRETVVYAMTYPEAFEIADRVGWTKTASWRRGGYSTSSPSARIQEELARHQMTPARWAERILEMGDRAAPTGRH
jgi:hypothetical protein